MRSSDAPNTACTGRWGLPPVGTACATYGKHFLASSFFCSQAESTPAHQPVTLAVSPLFSNKENNSYQINKEISKCEK